MSDLTVRVPQLVPPGPNAREHHMARHRRVKKERTAVRLMLSPHKPPRLPVEVLLIRCAPRKLDDDNAVGSMKPCRDEVAKWLGVDDADPRVTWRVDQWKVPKSDQGTVLNFKRRVVEP